eukprot:scaffold56385_cov61-Phaeocystis_antarctica.AAC.2
MSASASELGRKCKHGHRCRHGRRSCLSPHPSSQRVCNKHLTKYVGRGLVPDPSPLLPFLFTEDDLSPLRTSKTQTAQIVTAWSNLQITWSFVSLGSTSIGTVLLFDDDLAVGGIFPRDCCSVAVTH